METALANTVAQPRFQVTMLVALAAVALAQAGHRVGVMDADVYGPTIPRMFGISERPPGHPQGAGTQVLEMSRIPAVR